MVLSPTITRVWKTEVQVPTAPTISLAWLLASLCQEARDREKTKQKIRRRPGQGDHTGRGTGKGAQWRPLQILTGMLGLEEE